jgi:hypothetical protein
MMAFTGAMTHVQHQVLLEIGVCFKFRGFLPHHLMQGQLIIHLSNSLVIT